MPSRLKILVLAAMLFGVWSASAYSAAAPQRVVSGRVVDEDGAPLVGAVLRLGKDYLWAITDVDGNFVLKNVQQGKYPLEVSLLGYVTVTREISVKDDVPDIEICLVENTLALDGVVVTAKKSDGLNTSFSMGREALDHLQMSGLSDMSALLPGGKTVNPDLTANNVLSLRSGGASVGNAAFGTALEVDGVRIGNNAGLDGMNGVGTRSIATENIESVEVISGVPSAEYGDLNSGMVKINTRRGRTPFNIVLSANPRTYSVSASKGIDLTKNNGILNVSAEWARATSKLTSPYTSYSRRGITLVYSNNFAHNIRFEAGFTGNIGGMNTKDDPDAFKGEYTKGRDNVFRGNFSLNWLLNKLWITSLKIDGSVNYQDNLNHHYLPDKNSSSKLPAVHSETEGYYIAPVLPKTYIEDCYIDSKELDYAASLKYDLHRRWSVGGGELKNNVKAGLQWKANGNVGRGKYYADPNLAEDGYRPQPYSDYPYMHNLAAYIEDQISIPVASTTLELSAGLRMENVFIRGSKYDRMNTFSPRLNAKWSFGKHISIRGGWGVTEKLPSFYILYPKQEYIDVQIFGHGDSSTYAYYTRPYQMEHNSSLKWQRNQNAEFGIDAEFLGTKISLVGFYNLTQNPYKYSAVYSPFTYDMWRVPDGVTVPDGAVFNVDSNTGGVSMNVGGVVTPMENYVTNTKFFKNSRQTNGADITRCGAELVVDFPEIRPIRTSFRLDASYAYTTYVDEGLSYRYPGGSPNGIPNRDYQFVGIYANGDSGTVDNGKTTHSLDANLTAITRIPRARLVITCRLEMSLVSLSQKISRYNGRDYAFTVSKEGQAPTGGNIYDGNSYTAIYPISYLDENGVIHEYTEASAADTELSKLILKSGNSYTFARDGYNPYFSANISITKEIGKHVSISMFVNNFTNARKAVTSYATGVAKIATPMFYYGLTCRMKF